MLRQLSVKSANCRTKLSVDSARSVSERAEVSFYKGMSKLAGAWIDGEFAVVDRMVTNASTEKTVQERREEEAVGKA